MIRLGQCFEVDAALVPPAPRVLQVGALSLGVARQALDFWPDASVVVVEAASSNFARLADEVRALREAGADVRVLRAALADACGETSLYCFGSPGAHSLWPMHERAAQRLVACEPVLGCTLRRLLEMAQFHRVDVALLNCEGAELCALRQMAADDDLAERFGQLSVATHWLHYPVYPHASLQTALDALSPRFGWARRIHQVREVVLEYVHIRRKPCSTCA